MNERSNQAHAPQNERRAPRTGLWLAAAIGVAALGAACGPATPQPAVPPAPTGAPSVETPVAPDATAPTTSPVEAPHAEAHADKPSTPLQASKMLDEVKKIGVDLSKSPDLAKLPMAQKKKLMPLFQKALGYETCNGCHVEGDYKADTFNKKAASGMWKHFVADLRDEKGGAIFCDSCHAGSEHVLGHDKEAVKKFMETDYEGKLTRADGEEHGCGTCHGDTMETKIIEKLWGVTK